MASNARAIRVISSRLLKKVAAATGAILVAAGLIWWSLVPEESRPAPPRSNEAVQLKPLAKETPKQRAEKEWRATRELYREWLRMDAASNSRLQSLLDLISLHEVDEESMRENLIASERWAHGGTPEESGHRTALLRKARAITRKMAIASALFDPLVNAALSDSQKTLFLTALAKSLVDEDEDPALILGGGRAAESAILHHLTRWKFDLLRLEIPPEAEGKYFVSKITAKRLDAHLTDFLEIHALELASSEARKLHVKMREQEQTILSISAD